MEQERCRQVVLPAVGHPSPYTATSPDDGVPASWERCLSVHHLTPDRIGSPLVLSPTELQDYREPVADLLAQSQGEIQRLFELLAEQDYVIVLTDANGIAMDFRSTALAGEASEAISLLPGSVWVEEMQGTNGIALCVREQRPVSVVMDDHFASTLKRFSCTVAPIFGASGQIIATLNATTPLPSSHAMQAIVRKVVSASARRLENLYFDRRNANHVVLRLSRYGDFCDPAGEARVAVNTSGRIVDATPSAQGMLANRSMPLVGQALTSIRGLEDWQDAWGRRDATVKSEAGQLFLRLDDSRAGKRTAASVYMTQPRRLASGKSGYPSIEELIGQDEEIRHSIAIASRLVAHRVPVLLQGETGTGKSALARALHAGLGGDEAKFVSINCAAITAELIESELFGYRPGAFTGASRQGSRGRLLEADGGMLFLDEIGDMPLGLQTRLLQVLSDGEFVPVGATQPVKVNFALVSASLHDLPQLVREGRFREDLYFRLAGASVRLPPLRQRHDRSELFLSVLEQAANAIGRRMPRMEERALRALAAHHWPGNLRELQHAARFAVAIDTDGVIDMQDLPPPLNASGTAEISTAEHGKRHLIEAALARHQWNVSLAATSLGISRSTLHRQMRALGIDRPDDQADLR